MTVTRTGQCRCTAWMHNDNEKDGDSPERISSDLTSNTKRCAARPDVASAIPVWCSNQVVPCLAAILRGRLVDGDVSVPRWTQRKRACWNRCVAGKSNVVALSSNILTKNALWLTTTPVALVACSLFDVTCLDLVVGITSVCRCAAGRSNLLLPDWDWAAQNNLRR